MSRQISIFVFKQNIDNTEQFNKGYLHKITPIIASRTTPKDTQTGLTYNLLLVKLIKKTNKLNNTDKFMIDRNLLKSVHSTEF